ncbi:hypothetical protein KFL_000260520 [Klebsormidium nitens]|uniref:Uncharacterized protein n=1 Tax=Klebsormidium nitens TaxID=105231 RepID=A0A1Y1HKU5_KLENI|nr:hypothetical protein KFL_000260520 [Klebsormidium nitens]|eukprot:GAQ79235.1 hypothetical protein KFL_000260520 [Klebsormidium nitens]
MTGTPVQIGGVHFGGIPDLAELVPQGTQKGHSGWERATRGEKDVQREGRNGMPHPRGSFLGRLFRKSHHQKEKVEEKASGNRVAEAPAEFLPIPCPPEPNELDRPVTSPRPEASGQEESRLLWERLRAAETHKGPGPISPMFAFEAHVIGSLTKKHRRPPLDLAALAAARREGTSGGAGPRDTWRHPTEQRDTWQDSEGQSGEQNERDETGREGAGIMGEVDAGVQNFAEESSVVGMNDGDAEVSTEWNSAEQDGSRRGDSRGERSRSGLGTEEGAGSAEESVSGERLQDTSALQATAGEVPDETASDERVQETVELQRKADQDLESVEETGPSETLVLLVQSETDAEGESIESDGSAANERSQVVAEPQAELEGGSDRVRTGDWLSPTSEERATGRPREFEYERQARAGREEADREHDTWHAADPTWPQEVGVSSVEDGAEYAEQRRRSLEGGAGPSTVNRSHGGNADEYLFSNLSGVVGTEEKGTGSEGGHSRTKGRVRVNGRHATGGIEWWPIGVRNGETQRSGAAHLQRKDGDFERRDSTGSERSTGVAERSANMVFPVEDAQADHQVQVHSSPFDVVAYRH